MEESGTCYQPPEFSDLNPTWRELIGPGRTTHSLDTDPERAFLETDYNAIKSEILRLDQPVDQVFPASEKVFRAFDFFPPHSTKVVILGQDPYPTPGFADGLAFSVEPSIEQCPESLKAILRKARYQCDPKGDAKGGRSLVSWAKQNVLLLNQSLTVPAGKSEGHMNVGWQHLTGAILDELLKQKNQPIVVTFGSKARDFVWNSVRRSTGHIRDLICAGHPSPLAHDPMWSSKTSDYRNPFLLVNTVLSKRGEPQIDWCV
jgi:uracil-DNA glycosylase